VVHGVVAYFATTTGRCHQSLKKAKSLEQSYLLK